MAAAITRPFSALKVLISDTDSPTLFVAPCGFNSRSFNRSKSLREDVEPDCEEEEEELAAAAWVARTVESLTWSVTGEGVLPRQSILLWEEFFNSAASRAIKIRMVYDGAVGTIVYEGNAHLATFNIGAERGGKITKTIDLQGDGALVQVSES